MQQINDLLDAKLLERHKSQEKRDYLGASMLGDECIRRVQLQYMKHEIDFSAQNLRTFAVGHCLEDLIADWNFIMNLSRSMRKLRNDIPTALFRSLKPPKATNYCHAFPTIRRFSNAKCVDFTVNALEVRNDRRF